MNAAPLITWAGPQDAYDDGGWEAVGRLARLAPRHPRMGQWVAAVTAAYGAYSSSKGGGKMTHDARVQAREARWRKRAQAIGATLDEFKQLIQLARQRGYKSKSQGGQGRGPERVVAEFGSMDALRSALGWPPPAAGGGDAAGPGGGGPGVMTAGFGGISPTMLLAGAVLVGLVFIPKKRGRR